MIFGSSRTVLAELTALREQAGPFGTLLLSAVDWAGPNAAWERESLTRVAQEVIPALREQLAAGRQARRPRRLHPGCDARCDEMVASQRP